MKLRPLALLSLLLTALVAGCATDATTAAKAAKEKDEYVTVVTTGSNIPKKNKNTNPQADGIRVHSREDFERIQSMGNGVPSKGSGLSP